MINFQKAKFIKSAPTYLDKPEKNLPEVVFVGKSNVGKSSLINALVKNKSMAFTSSKPGYTKLLNYFEIDEKFYLVDAPGYGYTKSGSKHLDNFSKMMETYFDNENLRAVVFIVDSRHKMSEDDKDFYNFVVEKDIPFILVTSKVDKLNQSEKHQNKMNVKEAFGDISFIEMSVTNDKLVENLRSKISEILR